MEASNGETAFFAFISKPEATRVTQEREIHLLQLTLVRNFIMTK